MKVTARPELNYGDFAFSEEREAQAQRIMARYPEGREASAIIPLLDLAQRENGGWLSKEAIDYVAFRTGSASIRVYEVASFYTMFYLEPVGKHVVQVCRTTPCWLRGADDLTAAAKAKLGIGLGETTADKQFTLIEVECLGACCNAPMVQINDDFYEDLTPERFAAILDDLGQGKEVPVGPQNGRRFSEPEGGPQTLLHISASEA